MPFFKHSLIHITISSLLIVFSALPLHAQNTEDNQFAIEEITPFEGEVTTLPSLETSVQSNWRDNVGVLNIGYLADGDSNHQRRQLEPFRRAVERATDLRVVYRPARTLNELVDMQVNRRIQYAIHSASSYVTAKAKCKCVEVLAAPTDNSGAWGIHAILIAPANGPVQSLDDLRERRLAIPAAPATVTRSLPLTNFANAGYDKLGDLGTLIDVANPVDGWRKILTEEADAVIGWSSLQGDPTEGYSSGTLHHLIRITGLATSTNIRIIWQSDLVPNGPHTIRSDAPTELKTILREFLIKLQVSNNPAYDAVSPFLSGGFVTVAENDFRALFNLTQQSTKR